MRPAAIKKYIGKNLTVYCVKYIYTGIVESVEDDVLRYKDCWLVYNTGDHGSTDWACAKQMPTNWEINLDAIESFGAFKDVPGR